jgi:SMI1 / KNR4 family (SUKH-1)
MHYLQEITEMMRRSSPSGQRILEDGTRLLGHVPHVGPDAWLHLLFPPLSDDEISEIESEMGIRLPESLKDFFSLANGLSLFSGTLSIYGRRHNYSRTGDGFWQPFSIVIPNTVERLRDAKPSFLFVGGYPAQKGFYLYVDTKDLRVYRCTRQSAAPLATWENFGEMLVAEANRLALLFDQRGRRIDPTQPII